MALLRRFFFRKPPDGLFELCERVYVFDCCFTTEAWDEENYEVYIGNIYGQLRDHFPDASFLVFNFREGVAKSQMDRILSEYDMTIMNYPRQFEGCPVLKMEMIHHFMRSCESWLSLGHQNVLLIHCERGGWPVLAFMLAALLIYRRQYTGEQKILDMVYKQASEELLHLLSPLNPIPSQLRYLQYVSRRNVAPEWPPVDRTLVLDCIILRFIPNFNGNGGCRPIFRIYGQDSPADVGQATKRLYSTPKIKQLVRAYKQQESELVKIDISCHVQGDVVVECCSLHDDMDREEMMFRFMFNTAFIRSNILILNRDEVDVLWGAKDKFPKDFRAEVLFSEMDAATSVVLHSISCFEENEGLSEEAFSKVQEIFSHVDWLDVNNDAALNVLQQMSACKLVQEKSDNDSPKPAKSDSEEFVTTIKIHHFPGSPKKCTIIDVRKKGAKPQKDLPASVATNQSLKPQVNSIKPSANDNATHQMNAPPAVPDSALAFSPVCKSVDSKSVPIAALTTIEPELIRPGLISNTKESLHSQSAPPRSPSPPPTSPPPRPPPPPPLRENPSVRATPTPSMPPPPPPPPPLRLENPSSVPPPSPSVATFSKKQPNSIKQNSTSVPSAPPPPAALPRGVSTRLSPTLSFSSSNNGKGRLSRNPSLKSNNKKLKPLHWMKITRANQGSLWAEVQKCAAMAPDIDMSELENLFPATLPISTHGRKSFKRGSVGPKIEKMQLIEHRRAYNCEIMLAKVKVPLHVLVNSVLSLEDSALDVDQVETLIKFCPTKEEMELLEGYIGEKENLGRCEQFFLELIQVPRAECKLRVFSFKVQFHSQVSDLRHSLNVVNSATDEIRSSLKLRRIMQTILSLGNALNQGTVRGSAVGFKLDSLLKLTETRARNNKMTLMHYLCKVLADKLPEVLDFSKDLRSLEPALKIQLKVLAEEMQAISIGLEKVVQELSAADNDGPISENFCKALKEFLQYAEAEVRSLASLYSAVGKNVDTLILYFGEDLARCTFEQVVLSLFNFTRMFNQAYKENCKQHELEMQKATKSEKFKVDLSHKQSENPLHSPA